MFRFAFSKDAEKTLKRIPNKLKGLIVRRIKNIGDWLDNRHNLVADIKRLNGFWKDFYRLRIGYVRVIFRLDYRNKLIKIHAIGQRGDIYK